MLHHDDPSWTSKLDQNLEQEIDSFFVSFLSCFLLVRIFFSFYRANLAISMGRETSFRGAGSNLALRNEDYVNT